MENNLNNHCVKKSLTPWLVGLVILVLIILASLLFGIGWNKKKDIAQGFFDNSQANVNTPAQNNFTGSYHQIVDMIKPAVVGISLSGAQPFLQVWPSKESEGKTPLTGPYFQPQAMSWWHCPMCRVGTNAQVNQGTCPRCPMCGSNMQLQSPTQAPSQPNTLGQAQGWGLNANNLTMNCSNCGTTVTRQPGTPWQNIKCPNCGTSMFCPRTTGGQPQLWQPSATQSNTTTQKEEYLKCTNCRIRLNPQPGIPWSGATCPNCKMGLAHVIHEVQNNANTSFNTPMAQPVFNPPCIGVQPQALQQPAPSLSQQAVGGMGTGIIVSSQGYVLTNYHLVADQSNLTITVFTHKGNRSYPGVVVAKIPQGDLAVVQIKTDVPISFPVAPLGNSDTINVGDTVLALGNPFGLAQTVTSGIISAQRQSITIQGHQLHNLIQTDAPINQGNSGGPLVNLNGEVIGINTAIYSPMQTHTGLGFAIPINQAKQLLVKFIDAQPPQAAKARLTAMRWLSFPRGYPTAQKTNEDAPAWMGVEFQIMNDTLAEQLKVPFDRGILINQVYANSPAAEAGLKRGDVIYRADGRRITDETRIRTFLADKKPGDVVKFTIFRNGKKLNVKIKLAGGSWQKVAAAIPLPPDGLLQGSEIEAGTADITPLGLTVDKISPEVAFAFGLPENTTGVVIAGVEGLSLLNGVQEGDVITSVNGKPTPNLLSLFKALKKSNLAQGVTLGLSRKNKSVRIVIKENPSAQSPGL